MNEEIKAPTQLMDLLERFLENNTLTPKLIFHAHEYLFENGDLIPELKSHEVFDILVYIKDVMNINCLRTFEDIWFYYEKKRKVVKTFLDEAVKNKAQEGITQFRTIHNLDISWNKPAMQHLSTESPVLECRALTIQRIYPQVPLAVNAVTFVNSTRCVMKVDHLHTREDKMPSKVNNQSALFIKNKNMAKNGKTGDGHRNGQVDKRSQVENPKTGLYTKRDTETGKFMDVKTSGGKFKGVRDENK